MSRMPGRTVVAAVVITAAAMILAGCAFARPPASASAAGPTKSRAKVSNPGAERVADAPPLLIQCVVDRGVFQPQGQDWFSGGRVHIDSGNAQDFAIWWHAYFTPGPYKQTFVIDGHKTHYLAFGAHWTVKNGQWVPLHRSPTDPASERTSLYYWSTWTAAHNALPAQVCGPGVSARKLQQQIYGNNTNNPWAS